MSTTCLAAKGDFFLAAALYAIAALGFSGNNMFSDALLTDVTDPKRYDRISALGYAMGYIGSGGLFAVLVLAVAEPEKFGFAGKIEAVHAGFWITAGWWLVFTIPAMLWVRETPGTAAVGAGSVLTRGFRQLARTFAEIRRDRRILFFLGGYFLYIDGVNTVIKMAVDFGRSIGLDTAGMMKALLVTQFVAFPAAILFGRIGERFGAKRGIMLGIVVYAGVCVFAARMDSQAEFFAMAVVIGLVQGGVQSLSRSYFARLIPAEKGGEYFGFYNMLGKFAAVIGPTLMGVTALLTDSRTSILSLLLLDAAKGALAVLIARYAGLADGWEFAAAFAVVAGHIWPVQLGFRGGKGLGPLLGAWLALAPLAIGGCLLIGGVAWGLTRRRVPAGLFGALLLPGATWLETQSVPAAFFTTLTFGIVAFAHRSHFIPAAQPAPLPPT